MARPFKIIVVPTDFSEPSRLALEYAQDMADEGTRIIVCHAVDDVPLTYGYVGLALTSAEVRSQMGGEAEKELHAFVAALPAGPALETQLLHGSPPSEIARLAGESRADLIVMGTHGRSGLEHALVGSVAERVIRKAPCPVLVVRKTEQG